MSRPIVTIVEQPAAKLQRFRYLSEVDGARSVGSIPGVHSTPDRKTYPTIRVHGYEGPFLVLLSLINPDNDLVHPHVITGSDPRYQCRQGVIYLITNEPEVVFRNIGILCVKGKTESDVTASLKNRKRMNVDPFGVGFRHINDHRLIDFTAVRLCFQVFLPGPDWTPKDLNDPQKYNKPLPPVRSNVVYDAKKVNDLKITYIHNCAGPRTGDHEMTLLCEKYTGQNPEVVFEDGHGWEQTAFVKIYHKQLAIVFHTPPYRKDVDPNCKEYKVKVYLRQTTERGIECSQPTEMFYLGNDEKGDPIQSPLTTPPNYKSLLPKMNPRANYKPKIKRSEPVTTPSTPIQPPSPSLSFKMSPPFNQEPSPLGENAELVYTQHNYHDAFSNIPSNSHQPTNEIVRGCLNIHNIPKHKVTTTETIPVYPQNPLHVMGNSQHSIAIPIPETKTKRTKPKPNSSTFDSSELLPKREKVDPDFEIPRYRPSTSFTSYNPFNSETRPTSIDYLQTDRENNTNLIENVFDCIWANTNSGELKEALQSMAEAESWGAGIPTLINTISMSGHNNISNTAHDNQIGMAHNFHNGNQNGINGGQNVLNVIQPGLPFDDQNVMPNVHQNGISHGDENLLDIQDYYQATQADDGIPSEELKRMILG